MRESLVSSFPTHTSGLPILRFIGSWDPSLARLDRLLRLLPDFQISCFLCFTPRLVPTKPIHVGTEDAPVAIMKSIPITWPFRPMDLLGPFPPAKGARNTWSLSLITLPNGGIQWCNVKRSRDMKTLIAIWGKFPSGNNGSARPYKSMHMLSVKILCEALETTYPGLGWAEGGQRKCRLWIPFVDEVKR
jgi:hypothetical protein